MSDRDFCRSKENNFDIEAPAVTIKQKKETNGPGLRRLYVQKEGVPRDVIFKKSLNTLCRWNMVKSFAVQQDKNLSYIPLTEGSGRNSMDRNLKNIGSGAEKKLGFWGFEFC